MCSPRILTALVCLLWLAISLYAQGVTGQIAGTVTDSDGALVPGAAVELIHDLTKQGRAFTSENNGSFVFPNLVPGDYSLRIGMPGFKTYYRKGIAVSAQERVDLHDIRLELGDVNTSIQVEEEGARVATDSSDRSILITRAIVENTPMRGRDYLSVLRAMPGVAATTTSDRPAWNSSAPPVNGNFGLQISLDGITSQNSGNGPGSTATYLSPNVDAIAEVRVLVGNYQAEYGAHGGGQMVVSMKHGTAGFHGAAYYYWRHEQFNANEWFNNKTRIGKPIYRFQNPGGTIGGPVLIPGTSFNRSRTKLFFFFSQDYLHTVIPGPVNRFNMPSAAERSGDFSQTVTSTGVAIPIKDPMNGQPFPDNKIPANRFTPIGTAMMNLFPMPTTTDPTGSRQYNSQFQFTRRQPNQDRILRVDYNVAPKTVTYLRLIQHYQAERGIGAYGFSGLGQFFTNLNGGWGQNSTFYEVPAKGAALTVVHTISPTLVNETTVGLNYSNQLLGALDGKAFAATNQLPLRGANGEALKLPNFFSSNVLNFLPQILFNTSGAQSPGQAVTNPPGFTFPNRWPFDASDELDSLANNLTWFRGTHNMKFGVQAEKIKRNIIVATNYDTMGTYFFGSDTANPGDTGYAFSNILLGAVQAYGEDNKKQKEFARYTRVEWFAQDSWKVARRLTLDLGVRFAVIQPIYAKGATLGMFSGSAYDVNKAGQLLFPALVNGQRVAINPKTGATYQFARATSFDPASFPASGSPYSGMQEYKSKFFNTPPIQVGPRVGFAWDVLGNGKMAVRGGFGIFYDLPYGVDTLGASNAGIYTGTGPMSSPPSFRSPVFYNTTFSDLLNAQGFFVPQTVSGGSPDLKLPTNYQWSLGVQRDLGHGIILDVAYVGNVVHHGFGALNDANAVAPLTTWTPTGGPDGTKNPKYLDPTSGGGGTGAFYAANLIRAMVGYQGYAAINTWTNKGESNYNSMQVQVNRRFGKSLQFATNWTWSKFITFTPMQWVSDDLTKNVSGRPQAVNVTVAYTLPDGSRLLGRNAVSRALLDGWHVNGVGSFFSGTPMAVSCTAQGAPIGWPNGTPSGGIPLRCQMKGDLWLPAGATPPSTTDSRLWFPFNTSGFVLPPGSTLGLGNTPPTLTYGPGFENIDLAVSKQVRLNKEGTRQLEFRGEMFNAFNHFNPSNPDTSLTVNYATGANTNANFGQITSAQNSSRRIVLSMKLRF